MTELADKDPTVQVATLIMSLGEDALEVLETLPYSKPEDRKDLQATLTLLEKHFAGETNVTYERFLFFKRDQLPNESFTEYLTGLRALASSCEFAQLQEDLIRDRIVCGLRDESVQRALLQNTKLKLKNCEELCRAAEATSEHLRQITTMQCGDHDAQTTERVTTETALLVRTTARNEKDCRYCGTKHGRGQCPAYGKTCRQCQKKNHFASVCQSKVRQISIEGSDRQTDVMTLSLVPPGKHRSEPEVVNAVGTRQITAIYATLHLRSKPVRFQIDTGASCNVMRMSDVTSIG